MRINCDLGEGLDQVDIQVMPLIDMANIACGGHTGDRQSMEQAMSLAKRHKVSAGAHPSYPDTEHFGRRSLAISDEDLYRSLDEQVSQLSALAHALEHPIQYIKPHGALYNDIVTDISRRELVLEICRAHKLPLMLLASPQLASLRHDQSSATEPVSIIFEAFADRRYNSNGTLAARSEAGSVLSDIHDIVAQALSLRHEQGVEILTETPEKKYNDRQEVGQTTSNWLPINAESLCVHGDTDNAVDVIKAIRNAFTPS